jgi:hypothetical protein
VQLCGAVAGGPVTEVVDGTREAVDGVQIRP